MARNLNLDALASFVVFSEKLNFTHAAEELSISQPALFMKIQELSSTLNATLYRKIGRRLELTEQGKLVARFGREMSEKSTQFLNELHAENEESRVVLAAGEGAFLYLLGDAIKQFTRNSKCQLQLLTLNRDGIIDAIESGKAHLGVTSLDTTPSGIQSTLFAKVDQVLVMPQNHPLARKRKLQLSDLTNCRLVVPPTDRPHRQMLSSALQSSGVSWEVAVEAQGWEVMLHFVKLGIGLAIVNASCAIPRGLVARPLRELPQVHYYIVHLKGRAKAGWQAKLKDTLLSSQH